MLHSLWTSMEIEQLLAITNREFARRRFCESCRRKAFACRGCLIQIWDASLLPGSMKCHHQIVTAFEGNGEERKTEVIMVGGAD